MHVHVKLGFWHALCVAACEGDSLQHMRPSKVVYRVVCAMCRRVSLSSVSAIMICTHPVAVNMEQVLVTGSYSSELEGLVTLDLLLGTGGSNWSKTMRTSTPKPPHDCATLLSLSLLLPAAA